MTALEDGKGVGYHSVIPEAPGAEYHPLTKAFGEKGGEYAEQYIEAMEKVIDTPTCQYCLLHTVDLESYLFLFVIWHRLN